VGQTKFLIVLSPGIERGYRTADPCYCQQSSSMAVIHASLQDVSKGLSLERKWLETSETSSEPPFPFFHVQRQSFNVHSPRHKADSSLLTSAKKQPIVLYIHQKRMSLI